ncbi:hypothetical protein F4821DRAFT_280133 [Hypoxylon rubiginosum]|uniref:Uncharacterized protein n=1 Tax=Hypoxylon rubiginosum TaxID=110542 RepID=A0ACC0DGV7_9PEZI|nr:hypothetical protein F4821DRAFT_280133 [Hypoxylon rubiginosum]
MGAYINAVFLADTLSAAIMGNPIDTGLDGFRNYFLTTYKYKVGGDFEGTAKELFGLLRAQLSTDQRTLNTLASNILCSLEECGAIEFLPSVSGAAVLGEDVSNLLRAAWNNELSPTLLMPLLTAVLEERPDIEIWGAVYTAIGYPGSTTV